MCCRRDAVINAATTVSYTHLDVYKRQLYSRYALKRVFYSAYIPVGTHALLPKDQPPPLLREHRLYQTDWLLRSYGFQVEEILDEEHPSLDPLLDPCLLYTSHFVYMSPQGHVLTQEKAKELAALPSLCILCGHYEGVDERVLEALVDEQISIGDYVLTGGELPAMVLVDCISRMVPGVLADEVCFTCLLYTSRCV